MKPVRQPSPEHRRAEIDRNLDQLSHYLDGLFRIPGVGWRFGLDSLVGLIPFVGDWATTMVSLYIMGSAVRYRVPKVTILRMALNIAIDYVVGAIPLLGDLFDAIWKSNKKNVDLLRRHADLSLASQERARASDWLFVSVIMGGLLLLLVGSIAVAATLLYYFLSQLPAWIGL
jgi:hypothetical protein